MVEVVARLDGLRAAAARREPLYVQQLMALEALQVYAPMGHALGLDAASAELEDCCFQVPCCTSVDTAVRVLHGLSGGVNMSHPSLMHSIRRLDHQIT